MSCELKHHQHRSSMVEHLGDVDECAATNERPRGANINHKKTILTSGARLQLEHFAALSNHKVLGIHLTLHTRVERCISHKHMHVRMREGRNVRGTKNLMLRTVDDKRSPATGDRTDASVDALFCLFINGTPVSDMVHTVCVRCPVIAPVLCRLWNLEREEHHSSMSFDVSYFLAYDRNNAREVNTGQTALWRGVWSFLDITRVCRILSDAIAARCVGKVGHATLIAVPCFHRTQVRWQSAFHRRPWRFQKQLNLLL